MVKKSSFCPFGRPISLRSDRRTAFLGVVPGFSPLPIGRHVQVALTRAPLFNFLHQEACYQAYSQGGDMHCMFLKAVFYRNSFLFKPSDCVTQPGLDRSLTVLGDQERVSTLHVSERQLSPTGSAARKSRPNYRGTTL